MSGTFLGRNRFTGGSTSSICAPAIGTCWILLVLGGCGDDGAAPSDGFVKSDAGGADAAQQGPRPMDAAVPSARGSVGASATHSSVLPVSTVIPTTPGAEVTAVPSTVPSTPASTLPMASTTASSAPTDDAPVLEGQTDCVGNFTTNTSTYTYYVLTCDPDTLFATCQLESEAYGCVCGDAERGPVAFFKLPLDTDLETGTRASVALCNTPNEPESVDAGCEDRQPTAEEYCSVQNVCTRSWELAEGVFAFQEVSQYQLQCQALGPDESSCTCYDPQSTITIHGVGTAEACAAAIPVCASEVPPDEDITCTDGLTLSVDADGCTSTQRCGYRSDLDEAGEVFALTSVTSRNGFCSWTSEDSSGCGCYYNDDLNAFLFGEVGAGLQDACTIVHDLCFSGVPLEVTGTMECDSTSAEVQDGACNASTGCTQAFSNGTGSVLLGGGLSSHCDPDGTGGWSCTCYSGSTSIQPEAITASNALDACTNALDSCAAGGHLKVQEDGQVAVVFTEFPNGADAGQ
jgi:hypothetical protein